MTTAAMFAAVAVTMYAGHQLADHVLGQTDWHASNKARSGWDGWLPNLVHVAQYHLVLVMFLIVAVLLLDLHLSNAGVAAGLGFSFVTHAFLDRRWPVRWLLEHTGSAPFARLGRPDGVQVGLNGMYLADQALHYACLWVSALLMVVLS